MDARTIFLFSTGNSLFEQFGKKNQTFQFKLKIWYLD